MLAPAAQMTTDPPHAQTPRVVALDADTLAKLRRELDPEGRNGIVLRVLTAYETSLARLLGQLEAERAGGNTDAVLRIAHTLKSSSASVGALALAQACADVELRARRGVAGDLGADVARLLAEGEGALRAVRAMLRP